jgi:hypothetical protein
VIQQHWVILVEMSKWGESKMEILVFLKVQQHWVILVEMAESGELELEILVCLKWWA